MSASGSALGGSSARLRSSCLIQTLAGPSNQKTTSAFSGTAFMTRAFSGTAFGSSFRADQIEGADGYLRTMRAHANCIENLPVFGAIVVGLYLGNVASPLVDALAMTF
jgi:hypothetical protein